MRRFSRRRHNPLMGELPWFGGQVCRTFLDRCYMPLFFIMLLAPAMSCGNSSKDPGRMEAASASGFRIESAAFGENQEIPKKFTCKGENVSPGLHWTAPPHGTQSLAVIVDDPDAPAGTWVHWVVYDLPATTRELPESVPQQDQLADGGRQGRNNFGQIGYGGPCPPEGSAHRYFFKLYALDTMLNLQPGAAKQDVLAAARGHVLAEAQLIGRFKR